MDDSVLEAEGPLDEFHAGDGELDGDTGDVVWPGTSSDRSESEHSGAGADGDSSTGADCGSPMEVD